MVVVVDGWIMGSTKGGEAVIGSGLKKLFEDGVIGSGLKKLFEDGVIGSGLKKLFEDGVVKREENLQPILEVEIARHTYTGNWRR
nr:hypothetical protein [Tanacetum cinerariifolium]